MIYKKIVITGLGILMIGGQSLNLKAADFSMSSLVGNVGIAAVTNEVMDESTYLEYAGTSVASSWGYDELGIAIVEGNLNVRSEPSTDGAIVGKMTNYAACEILEEVNGWYHITSGEVEGYVSGEFIVTGIEAKLIGIQQAYTRAVVQVNNLNVRAGASEQAERITQVAMGQELEVVEVADGWVKCILNADEVFVKEDYVEVKEGLNTAVTLAQLRYGQEISDVRVALCEYAVQFVGNPYVWGGTSLTKGADCSGFVLKVFENYGVKLSHSSRAQINEGTEISPSEVQPGDLLFYGSSRNNISHVAIYIGGGQIVHASDERTGIIISSSYYRTPVGACRVLK